MAYLLREQGFNAFVIVGGLAAWRKAGQPVEAVQDSDLVHLPTFSRLVGKRRGLVGTAISTVIGLRRYEIPFARRLVEHFEGCRIFLASRRWNLLSNQLRYSDSSRMWVTALIGGSISPYSLRFGGVIRSVKLLHDGTSPAGRRIPPSPKSSVP